MLLLLRSVFFTILLPGTVAGYVPFRVILRGQSWPQWGPLQVLALLPAVVGLSILFRCIWDFARTGRGTLAPVDPPTILVVQGMYRYVRNPMYVGVLTTIAGWVVLYRTPLLLLYGACVGVCFQGFIVFYEEPHLGRVFGQSYNEYRARVGRWFPRW